MAMDSPDHSSKGRATQEKLPLTAIAPQDVDEAMKAKDILHGEDTQFDESAQRRLLWKIDFILLLVSLWELLVRCSMLKTIQILCLVYGLNFLDSRQLVCIETEPAIEFKL